MKVGQWSTSKAEATNEADEASLLIVGSERVGIINWEKINYRSECNSVNWSSSRSLSIFWNKIWEPNNWKSELVALVIISLMKW